MADTSELVERSDRKGAVIWSYAVSLSVIIAPVVLAVVLYQIEPLDPAELPLNELPNMRDNVATRVPLVNARVLQGSEFLADGQLVGPEDIVFNPKEQVIYTGCADGWIKRVDISGNSTNDSLKIVENWVNTGGRPLGLALGLHNELIIADAMKGLLNASGQGKLELLTDEVEGRKLKFADGVDVAKDGMIYFSEASSKYSFPEFIWDLYEGRPYGSLMSYDPITRETKVLVRDLYFANGVQVSPDQKYVIFCETALASCKRYIREGEGQGTVEIFVKNLPGGPDNIRYDGEGHYWIAISTSWKPYWDITMRYPVARKGLAIVTRYIGRPHMEKDGGLLAVDLEGKPVAHYYDPKLTMISGGSKIGDHLYFGSLGDSRIIRLNLAQHAAS